MMMMIVGMPKSYIYIYIYLGSKQLSKQVWLNTADYRKIT